MTERTMNFLSDALALLLPLTSRTTDALSGPPAPPAIPNRPDQLAQEITVLSYNVWTNRDSLGGRFEGVRKTILSARPDSFGLQEAHELWRGPLKRALKDSYGIACDRGRVFGVHEGAPVFYRRDKYDLVGQGVFWLSERPGIASMGWDARCPRIAGYAVLRDRQTGFTYAHFNTHLDHIGALAMANGARLVADRINALGLPAVLTGDLNDIPGSLPVEYLAAGGLTDLRDSAKDSDGGCTFHGYGKDDKIIDYVWANHYLRDAARYWVIRDEYDGRYPSDHFAVAATFTLAN